MVVVVVVISIKVKKKKNKQTNMKTRKKNKKQKKNKNQIKEESGLQLGQWSSCCMGPESNVLAIHRLSPLTFNIKLDQTNTNIVIFIKTTLCILYYVICLFSFFWIFFCHCIVFIFCT